MRIQEIKGQEQFYGTQTYYKVSLFPYVLTDGTKFIAEEGKCYWLFDELMATILEKQLKNGLLVCKLKVKEDDSATITIEDGNYNVLSKKEIPFTDFPALEQEIWANLTILNNKEIMVFYLKREH